MEVFIAHDESSPPVPFHLAASKVIIVSTPLRRRDELEPHYAKIRIHYFMALSVNLERNLIY